MSAHTPTTLRNVFLDAAGLFLPGSPVSNEDIDRYVAPLNRKSARIKQRVLRDNGILTRHYAVDEQGNTTHSSTQMATHAIQDCLSRASVPIEEVSLLCTGSSGGDAAMPGFANMVHGALRAPPMEAASHQGVCAAGVHALRDAAHSIELGHHRHALIATSEFPSRLFKRSRFAPAGYDADFDAHFLRWMLSDGAGACLITQTPRPDKASLQLKWVHTRSFSGDYPVCMQLGLTSDSSSGTDAVSYLDFPSLADAEASGAFALRQDLRLLPNLFELAIHEYAALVARGLVDPARVDHLLCHYSSEKLSGMVEELLHKAELSIPRNRWFTDLHRRGNTGAAAIFIMLADFLQEVELTEGQQVLCFVPESGRFTVAFMLFEVVGAGSNGAGHSRQPTRTTAPPPQDAPSTVAPPHAPDPQDTTALGTLLQSLAQVWHDYRSRAWRTELISRILAGTLTTDDYLSWMACWIPQVREGSLWMREAAANLQAPFSDLRSLIHVHAQEEQFDYQILFDDYRKAGGKAASIEDLRRNPGGEALNAYMHARAAQPNPIGLLGATYIIEGTGQRIIPHLAPQLRNCLGRNRAAMHFLNYHAENDVAHLERWKRAVEFVLLDGDEAANIADIVSTARDTAALYLMQMESSV